MGLILDSSEFVAAERSGLTVRDTLSQIKKALGAQPAGVSVVTLLELQHGVARADTEARRRMRKDFLDELLVAVAIFPVTVPIALRAGQIDGENRAKGLHLSLSDLLIGVTALELGYTVVTRNLRHFRMIPGLSLLSI